MLEVGSLVDGKYKILNKVGQGGMSVVYLAMNERANKQWAVKEVRKDGVLDFESVKQGLVAETDILKKLSHPNLPSIVDVIDTADSFIIIMDYVQGNSLDKALKEFGPQPQEDVIEWSKQLCDVLGYLHTREPAIIYRDMKPANVMLKPDGNISLIDFGTAREHKASKVEDTTCLGTRGYAAPEQYGGMGQTDARTDIYCLGATIYHLVTGMNPSEPPYEIRPIRQINPTLSGGLEKIILKCTQSDPADRYQSCAELMYALEHYDEIDDAYKKKQKNKLSLFITTCALTVVFGITSLCSFIAAESANKATYDQLVKDAYAAEDIELYEQAIATDTSRTEAYLGTETEGGFIDLFIDTHLATPTADEQNTFMIDSEEDKFLKQIHASLSVRKGGQDVTIHPIDELKKSNPEGHKEVCKKIAQTYIYYYNKDVKDKYARAADWVGDYAEVDDEAKIYVDISRCLTDIATCQQNKAQYQKLSEAFAELWVNLDTLYKSADTVEGDLKMNIWTECIDMLEKYCREFSDIAGKAQVEKLAKDISDKAEATNSTIQAERVQHIVDAAENIAKKVNSNDK